MVGHKLPLPPDWDRVNVSETLGKATALPVLLFITSLIWKDMQPKYAKWLTVLCWCDWAWRLLVVWLFWRLIKGGCWWSGRANFCCFLIRVSSRFEFQIGHSNFDKIYIFTFRYCKNKSLRLSGTVSLKNKNAKYTTAQQQQQQRGGE